MAHRIMKYDISIESFGPYAYKLTQNALFVMTRKKDCSFAVVIDSKGVILSSSSFICLHKIQSFPCSTHVNQQMSIFLYNSNMY